ncbi:MAG: PfkB family carbohydrate kinase [Planctomycetota bacterium]
MSERVDLPPFGDLSIAVVGDAVADRYVHARPSRLSREAPVPVFVETGVEVRPGGAANVAANLAALGCRVALFSPLGDDATAEALRRVLAERGVDVAAAGAAPGYALPVKTRVLASEAHRTPQQVLRIDREPEEAASADVLERLASALATARVDAVLYSDYGYGDLAAYAAADAELRARGVVRVLDPRGVLPPFEALDAATPNLEDFEKLARCDERRRAASDDALIERVAREASRWRAAVGVREVLVTLGNRGMLLASELGASHVAPSGNEGVVDVSGAGDTAAAVFGASLALGVEPREAMSLANAAAGEVVMVSGTASIERERLAAAMRRAPHPRTVAPGGER